MIAIIDYGMGNVGSVRNAIKYLGFESIIPQTKADFENSSHIILPGVGSFFNGMKNLEKSGFIDILNSQVLKNKKPFLGLCLGMEVLADHGDEGGFSKGLGWISGEIKKLNPNDKTLKIPHVGWNDVYPKNDSILFSNIVQPVFYFVHSYKFQAKDRSVISAQSEYGEKFDVAIEKENIYGLQFHAEKSQREGLKVLDNFLKIPYK